MCSVLFIYFIYLLISVCIYVIAGWLVSLGSCWIGVPDSVSVLLSKQQLIYFYPPAKLFSKYILAWHAH
jgi:hypothetical protein